MGKTHAAVVTATAIAALSGCATVEDAGKSTGGKGGSGRGQDYRPAQKNAIGAAESYLEFSGFSRAGLIGQLTSKAGDGFKQRDAEFAINNVDVDWNEEAVEAAMAYLDISSFSREGLIGQLTSQTGDQFTRKQATFAADRLGL